MFSNECAKSHDKNHQWQYPKLEESLDKTREIHKPYCSYCFVSKPETNIKNSFYMRVGWGNNPSHRPYAPDKKSK